MASLLVLRTGVHDAVAGVDQAAKCLSQLATAQLFGSQVGCTVAVYHMGLRAANNKEPKCLCCHQSKLDGHRPGPLQTITFVTAVVWYPHTA